MANTVDNIVDFDESPVTQIYGASYQNDHISHPNFLPCCHVLNSPISAGSVELPQSPRLFFTQFDPASSIIDAVSNSSSELFLVTTLIFLGGLGVG